MYLRAEIGDVPASHVRFRGVTSQWAELRVLQESAKSALYFKHHSWKVHPWKLTWHDWLENPHVQYAMHLQILDFPLSFLVFVGRVTLLLSLNLQRHPIIFRKNLRIAMALRGYFPVGGHGWIGQGLKLSTWNSEVGWLGPGLVELAEITP